FTDASGNTGQCSFEVTITAPVNFDQVKVTNATNNQNNGSIDITVSGGTLPYKFVWTDVNGQVVGNTEDIGDLAAGRYFVRVTDANGCEFSIPGIEVKNTVRVSEPAWLTGVRMFPNPTADLTRIVFAEIPASTLEISVIDGTGRVVLSQVSESQSSITLDCSTLPGGMYTVRFRTAHEAGVRKLTVSR
ncbi:MAG TPA: T9SS type A sorting domain-containing protein, partial [Saprospiraceae bacterium]|nr:T9SS type A sorting domain-containing protein [Saprospiraceae bacterium]